MAADDGQLVHPIANSDVQADQEISSRTEVRLLFLNVAIVADRREDFGKRTVLRPVTRKQRDGNDDPQMTKTMRPTAAARLSVK